MRIVVAVGGNALIKAGQDGTWPEQLENVREIAEAVLALRAQGHEVVLTHGNGPHVGALLLQNALGEREAAPLPLDALIAMTQGQIGYLLESAFAAIDASVPVAALLTRVLVDPADDAFANPTKPVGPFYDEARGAPPRRRARLGRRARRRPRLAPRRAQPASAEGVRAGARGRAARARLGGDLLRRRRHPGRGRRRRGRRRRGRDRQGPLLRAPRGRDRRRRARAADRRAAGRRSTSARAGSASCRA